MDSAESIDVPTEHGLGHTGIVAARLLIEFDEVPKTALFRVRRARAGTVESRLQEEYLRGSLEVQCVA